MKLTVTGTVEELADFGEDMRRLIADKRRQATVGSPAVVALIHTNFIGAIKQYREETGVGLKDAKDACEAIRARIGGNK